MSHHHQWLDEVASELRDRGHSQSYINRLVTELSDHYEDLKMEESMPSLSHHDLVSKIGNVETISQAADSSVNPSRAWLNAFVLPIMLVFGLWFATGVVLTLFMDGVRIDAALNPIAEFLLSSIVAIAPFVIPAVASIFILRTLRCDARRFWWAIAGLALLTISPFMIFPNLNWEAQRLSVCLAFSPVIRHMAIAHALVPIAAILFGVAKHGQLLHVRYL